MPGRLLDYFELIISWETQRARNYGIDHFPCIAMNPREANNVPLTKDVLPVVEKFCRRETCVAIGEIGFDRQTDEEEAAIRAQLKLAKKFDMPVLVNSACDWGPSDPLAVPKLVVELRYRRYPVEQIEQLVFRNPQAFFGQSDKWTYRP
jgi:predicted metal-dependent TIM-barrel fold hydrolase